MDLGQSIRKGVKWLVIGNTGQRILKFAFGVILARLLVPADFGLIVTIQVFTGFVSMLASGGMGQALIRAKEVDDNDFNAIFTLQISLGIIIYLGFYFASPLIADFFENPLYTDLMRVSALMFLIRPFVYTRRAWLDREMDFKKRTILKIISGIIVGVSSVLMAWYGMGVWSLTLSGLIGGLSFSILLSYYTPLRIKLNFDTKIMRKHGAYGSKILANDFISHLRRESLKLVLSKLAGPAFLGLFNKAQSLHSLPYWMFGQPVAQPVFRAMSKVQDDLDQTKYMFYRVITLLMVYVLPLFMMLIWIAEPFIKVVYGEKWVPAGEPLSILAMAGFFYIIARPCGLVLMAQNRLVQEMIAQIAILIFTLAACLFGLNWGLVGVSWGYLASQVFFAIYFYILVYQTIPTKISDLFKALAPGMKLNSILLAVLITTDYLSGQLITTGPAFYVALMVSISSVIYLAAFLFLPIPALKSERDRVIQKITEILKLKQGKEA